MSGAKFSKNSYRLMLLIASFIGGIFTATKYQTPLIEKSIVEGTFAVILIATVFLMYAYSAVDKTYKR